MSRMNNSSGMYLTVLGNVKVASFLIVTPMVYFDWHSYPSGGGLYELRFAFLFITSIS
jgi:hypothetical protein